MATKGLPKHWDSYIHMTLSKDAESSLHKGLFGWWILMKRVIQSFQHCATIPIICSQWWEIAHHLGSCLPHSGYQAHCCVTISKTFRLAKLKLPLSSSSPPPPSSPASSLYECGLWKHLIMSKIMPYLSFGDLKCPKAFSMLWHMTGLSSISELSNMLLCALTTVFCLFLIC